MYCMVNHFIRRNMAGKEAKTIDYIDFTPPKYDYVQYPQ